MMTTTHDCMESTPSNMTMCLVCGADMSPHLPQPADENTLTIARIEALAIAREACASRPTFVHHRAIPRLVIAMNMHGRPELVHYAGAAYRDDIAWHVCLAWLNLPERTEADCKALALDGLAACLNPACGHVDNAAHPAGHICPQPRS